MPSGDATPRAQAIAAIATPPGSGGVGIVRVSGGALEGLARALTGRVPVPRAATRAAFSDSVGGPIDDGLVLWFPAPHSYTGEDVLELHGHGGPVVMRRLLARCVELGARPAEPGEFTRRAFLNGKLDLAQAEAVADLIGAASEAAARGALRSLRGEFSSVINGMVAQLVELRMLVEATLDFPEEEIDAADRIDARNRLASLRRALSDAQERGRRGNVLQSGLSVVIAGAPNVGKSSLLNRLAGDEVAIVTDIPGTTRDTIREQLVIEGVPLHIIDTAGLRQTEDPVEKLGIARTWRALEAADVVLLLRDAATAAPLPDLDVSGMAVRRRVVVHNKVDLTGEPPRREERDGETHVWLSARTGAGVELLRNILLQAAGWQPGGEDVFLARSRHLSALELASAALARAADEAQRLELFAEELRQAQQALAGITGEFTADDLLGEIFSRFCIGK